MRKKDLDWKFRGLWPSFHKMFLWGFRIFSCWKESQRIVAWTRKRIYVVCGM